MNEELKLKREPVEFRGEPDQEMPQCLEERPTIPCESKEQREQRRRIDTLKRWEISIHALDRGCVVKVGCKSIAFTSIDAAMETVKQYVDNPVAVIKHYGFENHI